MSTAFLVSVAVFFVGGASLWIALLRVGGLGFGFSGMRAVAAVYRDPARVRDRRFITVSLLVMCLGGLGTCGSVMQANAAANRVCTERCRGAGFASGIMRGDPHSENPGQTARECWCQRGEAWSDEPMR